ncbi:hypothetical protein FT663_04699 [Candidozyma haemuli var. vulneris]|uniref:Proteasome assembly chaperone 2 n=1 Tax=Candidozyma haemuli TaxID=45357 RepID=A0A2V1ARE4_9ASCO|nr:hypothetical protein CXQ85_002142 [[Candida] haemuloni]KAF3986840.1 hypothetical protein FT663_04699 [[Candida] haemuloni var. vulneris]KAF3990670.1 hypothetical protein FT662_02093 [[Candida] haemuloni var. vulneris]PVH20355.1 hypothetical protein CXQ85_002142 [[Candida] haemuloni]
MILEDGFSLSALEDSVLIIPSIAVGNIPQLTADLLLHTFDFQKVATLGDEYLLPFVSPVDHSVNKKQPSGLSFGIEVYYSIEHHITLIQQRSPIISGFNDKHVNEVIVPFIEASNPQHVIVMDSSNSALVEGVPQGEVRVHTNEDLLSESFSSLSIDKDSARPLAEAEVHFSDHTKALEKSIKALANLVVLETFVYEGDNFFDAKALASKVIQMLNLPATVFETPASWLGVYGDKPVPSAMEEGLYG